MSSEFLAGSINYEDYFGKEQAEFSPDLSELLSRDWQLPETEFSALLQGSSTCTGHNGKMKGLCANVFMYTFQKEKSILKQNLYLKIYTGNVFVEMELWGVTECFAWPFNPKWVKLLTISTWKCTPTQPIYFHRVNKTSINEQNNFRNEKISWFKLWGMFEVFMLSQMESQIITIWFLF